MDLVTLIAVSLTALALVLLWGVIAFIRQRRADDPGMDALWLALGPVGWLLRSLRNL